MALEKQILTDYGIFANYHKILKIEYHSGREDLEIVVAIYISKEARDQNLKPAYVQQLHIPMEHIDGDPRGIFYPLLTQYERSYLLGATNSQDEPIPETYSPLSIKPQFRPLGLI